MGTKQACHRKDVLVQLGARIIQIEPSSVKACEALTGEFGSDKPNANVELACPIMNIVSTDVRNVG
eukprot:9314729-Prorocentrum_lima.AAC.1